MILLLLLVSTASAETIPVAANQYRSDLIRSAREVWGLDAPIATLAGQVHQESTWNPNARSAYAGGLAQFTPDTAEWISTFPGLGEKQPLNPGWALRALAQYDLYLHQRVNGHTACDLWSFTLSAYNGGLLNVYRDKTLIPRDEARNFLQAIWFNAVELYSQRSDAAMTENRLYVSNILLRWTDLYASWGPGVHC